MKTEKSSEKYLANKYLSTVLFGRFSCLQIGYFSFIPFHIGRLNTHKKTHIIQQTWDAAIAAMFAFCIGPCTKCLDFYFFSVLVCIPIRLSDISKNVCFFMYLTRCLFCSCSIVSHSALCDVKTNWNRSNHFLHRGSKQPQHVWHI